MRIKCDLRKVIAWGRTVCLGGKSMWVPLTYEKLPRLCFKCGRIIHQEHGCAESEGGQFGLWLRSTPIIRRRSERRMRRVQERELRVVKVEEWVNN